MTGTRGDSMTYFMTLLCLGETQMEPGTWEYGTQEKLSQGFSLQD